MFNRDLASAFPSTTRIVPPPADPSQLERVKYFLIQQRQIRSELLGALFQSGFVYGITRDSVVFLLLGKENLPLAEELRGTTARVWHSLVPGSNKDQGCFAVPTDHLQGRQPDLALRIGYRRNQLLCAPSKLSLCLHCRRPAQAGPDIPHEAQLEKLVQMRHSQCIASSVGNWLDYRGPSD